MRVVVIYPNAVGFLASTVSDNLSANTQARSYLSECSWIAQPFGKYPFRIARIIFTREIVVHLSPFHSLYTHDSQV